MIVKLIHKELNAVAEKYLPNEAYITLQAQHSTTQKLHADRKCIGRLLMDWKDLKVMRAQP